MPMSASCVINRAELLGLLEEVRDALPGSLAEARELIGDREQMVAEAHQEARRIIDAAHSERGSLVAGTEVARRSQQEADRILAEARQEADRVRAEADDYVDSKLANFEVVLSKTINSVGRGKDKLLGRLPEPDGYDAHAGDTDGAPDRPADPRELRDRADAYVEAQFQAFEAVLTKTLSAVGRGRSKLGGHQSIDELGAHLAAQEEAGTEGHHRVHVSDADYLAGLADPQPQAPVPPAPAQAPHLPAQAPPPAHPDPYAPAAAYPAHYPAQYAGQQSYDHDAYAYPQQGYPPQPEPYAGYAQQGYPDQPDPYAADQDYGQQQPYPPQSAPAPLDETSLFDTSMIDLEQLRRYEQGH